MSDRIQLESIGELIAAVPSMLSFVPVSSIVMVFLHAGRISFVVRTDFGSGGRPRTGESILAADDADSVIVIVVAKDRAFREVLDETDRVTATLLGSGLSVQGIYYTPSIDGGETWTDMRLFETGTVVDPTTTEVAAATVLNGKTVTRSREEIVARYRRGDGTTSADRRRARTARDIMGENFPRSVLAELADAVTYRIEPSAALAAQVGLLITTDIQARDAILGLAVIDPAAASEAMAAVARRLHGPERVAALTVAGFFAYVNFQGPDAGCAFDAAREEAALHPRSDTRLLGLVEQALEVGLHPTKLRTLSGTGVGIARRDFGVELPAPGHDWL
ncbi:DUF4192 domain-containing protein [Rhodococcus aetherivorans]|uniref:DUF4192 domain-containing protein n=1 Tax=Rhodococcus aetherivorans TaxID=191292 RepID=UPI00163AD211|nr:DUF4192 domain-containing protein [Rhodococcus aetherivorans]MBC2586918.1 DUF4192 domain-containing protein [Rhodococcus aetherivorans]